MTFTYTLTCTLDTTAALPPVAGSEEQRAYWVTPTILAWPLSLLPRGMDREVVVTDAGDPLPSSGLALRLITAPDGGAAAIHGQILGADGMPTPTLTPLRIVGDLPGEILAAHPNLEGYIALSTTDAAGTPLLDNDAVASALTGQVAIAQYVGARTPPRTPTSVVPGSTPSPGCRPPSSWTISTPRPPPAPSWVSPSQAVFPPSPCGLPPRRPSPS